ncbi:MAG: apolipoprotein N-acyltransferase [Desulfovibrionaceae bacterium]
MTSCRLLPYLLCGIGAFFGYANTILHVPPLALGLPASLAWLAFRSGSFKQAFKRGWLCGVVGGVACLYWIVTPVNVYGGVPLLLALPCPVLVSMVVALYYALFTAVLFKIAQRLSPTWIIVAVAPLWFCMESLAGYLFSGFPWMNLASAFSLWPALVQTASLTGGYALSGLWAALGVALLMAVTLKAPRRAVIVLLAILLGPSVWTLRAPAHSDAVITAGLAQGNIDQSLKWDDFYQRSTVQRYIDLSEKLARQTKLDLLVWPETAMPFYLQEASPMSMLARRLAADIKTPLLAGSPGYQRITPQDYILFNRAYLIGARGNLLSSYDKRHLVPFGEYVPFNGILPLDKLVTGVGDFHSGKSSAPLAYGRMSLGVLVCYEAIFPELAQDLVEHGANLLVNISNDAWFGDSSAPLQHLSHAVLRAVEQGRAMVRATNTGISVLIGPRGRILKRAPQFQASALSGQLPLSSRKTIYHRIRGVERPALFVLALLFIGVSFSGRRSASRF